MIDFLRDVTFVCLAAKAYATLFCPCLQIGQYSVYNPVSKAYRDDVHMFDMNLDRFTHVSVVDAIGHSQRFDDGSGGADPQHGHNCSGLSAMHNDCWAQGEQCHDVFYMGDTAPNITNDAKVSGKNVMQIRHMCGWLKPRDTAPGSNGLSKSNRTKVSALFSGIVGGRIKDMHITEYALKAAENAYHKLQTKEVDPDCTIANDVTVDNGRRGELSKDVSKAQFISTYLTIPVTKENFENMLQNDIALPISVIMARPFCTYQMGTAILARGGLELGAY